MRRVYTFASLVMILFFFRGTSIADDPSESWVARFAGPDSLDDRAVCVAVDASGSVYVTGVSETGPYNAQDYATVKYDSNGVQQWVTTYNGPGDGNDSPWALTTDTAGNIFVTGYSTGNSTGYDYATVKYDSNGVQQWVSRYNGPGNSGDRSTSISVDAAGNSYVTGYSDGGGTGIDIATIKYDPAGNQQWVARYNGPGNSNDEALAIAVDAVGNIYIAGDSSADSECNYTTVKYNADGEQQWVALYYGPMNHSLACDITIDASGSVLVTGSSQGVDTSDDYATVKYDADGEQQWVARYCGPFNANDYDNAHALVTGADGSVYVTGFTSDNLFDYATVKYSSSGEQLWAACYNGPGNGNDSATDIVLDSAGNLYVTGYSSGDGTSNDYATIKYDSSGVQQWVARYNGPADSQDLAWSIALDPSNNVCVTGRSTGSGSDFDFATVMYSSGTGISVDEQLVPPGIGLCVNPSPARNNASISVTLSDPSHCELLVFDINGRLVETLHSGLLPEGENSFTWQASRVQVGVYLLRAATDSQEVSSRVVVTR